MSTVSLTAQLGGSTQDVFVARGWLRQRQRGPWTALIVTSNAVSPAVGSPATVSFTRTTGVVDAFNGTVRRAAVNPGSGLLEVTVVAGAGGLITSLPPLDTVYGNSTVPAGVVARAICDAAGEQLAPGVELALDAITLPRWHRASDITGATALDLLADYLGMPWRVLPSGFVSIAAETWPVTDNAAYWMDQDLDDGGVFYAPDGAPLLVGQSIDGVPAIDVRYQFDDTEVTCEIRGAVPGDPVHVPDRSLYGRSWSATVKAQNADGTIDVSCDDARIGDLRSLAVRCGLPGALVTLDMTVSNRVRVRFDGASPVGAFAEGYDQDPTATKAASLVGDGVGAGTLTGTATVGLVTVPVQFTWTPPGGAPAGPSPTATLSGLIITGPGSAQVRLR